MGSLQYKAYEQGSVVRPARGRFGPTPKFYCNPKDRSPKTLQKTNTNLTTEHNNIQPDIRLMHLASANMACVNMNTVWSQLDSRSSFLSAPSRIWMANSDSQPSRTRNKFASFITRAETVADNLSTVKNPNPAASPVQSGANLRSPNLDPGLDFVGERTSSGKSLVPPTPDEFIPRFGDNEPRKGSDILVEALEREGVRNVFAYPGGASMEIHQVRVQREQKHQGHRQGHKDRLASWLP